MKACLFAVAAVAALAAAPAAAQVADAALLSSFCSPQDIQGSTCAKAAGYRRPGTCDIHLTSTRLAGRFASTRSTTVLVDYDSGCEARSTDNGGTILFQVVDNRYVFQGFNPGFRANQCIVISPSGRRDRLFCLYAHIATGTMNNAVEEFVFVGGWDNIALARDILLRAEDDSPSGRTPQMFECRNKIAFQTITKLRPGPTPDSIELFATYVDAPGVQRACAPGAPRPKDVAGNDMREYGILSDNMVRQGWFTFDLQTRRVTAMRATVVTR